MKRRLIMKNARFGICPSCLKQVNFSVHEIKGGGVGEIGKESLYRRVLACPSCKKDCDPEGKLFLRSNSIYDIKPIYTIHAIEGLDTKHRGHTVGWFPYEEWAKEAVENSGDNLYECSYEYIVIEEYPFGTYALRKKELWYKWNGKRYVSIDKPSEVSNIINYGF